MAETAQQVAKRMAEEALTSIMKANIQLAEAEALWWRAGEQGPPPWQNLHRGGGGGVVRHQRGRGGRRGGR